jgi:hypothetical protein
MRNALVCAALAAVVSSLACETKKTSGTTSVRDAAALPHVMRAFPKIEWPSVAISSITKVSLQRCYAEALARDAKQGGSFHLTAAGDAGPSPGVKLAWKRSSLDAPMRDCVEQLFLAPDAVDVPPGGARAEGDVTLVSEMRNEPAPPGWIAFGKIEERALRRTPLRVIAVRATEPPYEEVSNDRRSSQTRVVVDVELTKDGFYELCGDVSDFTDHGDTHPTPKRECPKVRHLATDRIHLSDTLWFTLEADGWKSRDSRHWFGDESLEVEE